jgi:hypothetical protein
MPKWGKATEDEAGKKIQEMEDVYDINDYQFHTKNPDFWRWRSENLTLHLSTAVWS